MSAAAGAAAPPVASRPARVLLVFATPIKPDAFYGFLLPPLGLERIAARLLAGLPPAAAGGAAGSATGESPGGATGGPPDAVPHPVGPTTPAPVVRIMDLRFHGPEWLTEAVAFAPDLIGVNVKTTLYAHLSYHAADRLRARLPRVPIVLGGLHAGSAPEEALTHGDFVVVGDGEEAVAELVAGWPPERIAGLVWRATPGGPVIRNPPRALLTDLDRLPPPARQLRPAAYHYAAAGLIPMDLLETSRGCNLACPFCSGAALHHGRWRAHSPEYVFAEVQRLAAAGVKYVMLTDDHFSADLARVERICDLIIAAGIRIAFFCFLRPFTGHLALKRKMVAAGFVMLSYGAESPNQRQLQRYGKGFSDPDHFIRQVNREWHEAGARYIGNSFVFGDPDERRADLERLGDYARDLDATFIEPLYAQPYPATRYRADLERRGLLLPHRWSDLTESRMVVRHPELDADGLRSARVRCWLRFFSPRKAIGALRVPLYLIDIGVPVRTVLKYMKACDYAMFGCVLEDKFYLFRRRAMVRRYLTDHVNGFSLHERDMTLNVDRFTDVIGLGPLKRRFGSRPLVIEVVARPTDNPDGSGGRRDAARTVRGRGGPLQGIGGWFGRRSRDPVRHRAGAPIAVSSGAPWGQPVTRLLVVFLDGRITRVVAGLEPVPADALVVRIRLADAVELICGRDPAKLAALARTALFGLGDWCRRRLGAPPPR